MKNVSFNKKRPTEIKGGPLQAVENKKIETQATTYSPAKRIAVPSALKGLTSGFGMEPGGPPSQLSPVSLLYQNQLFFLFACILSALPGKAFPFGLNSTKLKEVKASEY